MPNRIRLTVNDLKRLNDWIETLDPKPFSFELNAGEPNGLGTPIIVYSYINDTQGHWKEITDINEY